MINDDINRLSNEFDNIVLPLLMAARTKKDIDAQAFAKARQTIAEIDKVCGNLDNIPKNIVGQLYFVVFQLLAEADHAKDSKQQEKLSVAAWTLQEDLRKIFGPRF